MATTVGRLAAERGRSVEDVVDAARRAGITVWGETTPIDDTEARRIDAILSQALPGAPLPPPPPPFGASAATNTGWPPAPPPPPSPTSPLKVVGIVLASVLAAVAGLVAVVALFGDSADDDDAQFVSLGDSIDLGAGDDDTEASSDGGLSLFEILAVGDCFDDLSGSSEDPTVAVDAAYDTLDCGVAHDAEVYAVLAHPDPPGTPFPGDEAIIAWALEQCLGEFEPFVGEPIDFSDLDVLYLFPTESSWQRLDDREVVCSVVALDASKLTGTMAGSGL